MNVADKIAYRAKLEPELPAIIAGTSVVTFGMLESATRSVAARVAAFELAPGAIVGVSIKAPARHLAVSLALMRMGLVAAPFSNEAGLANLGDVAMALADQQFPMPAGRLCLVVDEAWFAQEAPALPARPTAPSAPCRIVMSSGTTGRPKPLLLSMAAFELQLYGVELQLTASGQWSRGLVMMDLNASWSFFITVAALLNGRTMCFAANPTDTLRVMSVYGCQYLMGSVFQIRSLVDAQREHYVPLPALAGITMGGSVITTQLLADIQAMLTRRIVMAYGSAEIGSVAVEIVGGDPATDGAAGYVQHNVELEVIGEDGTVLPTGQSGRIRMRTDFTAAPADGSPLGVDGWFVPGDVGHLDEAGRLYITGRTTDLINVGGAKIAPDRIEQVILQYPGIVDAAVVGVPDGRGGDAVVAAIVSKGNLDVEALGAFCADAFRIAPISRFVPIDKVPRGLTGKVVRPLLAQMLNS